MCVWYLPTKGFLPQVAINPNNFNTYWNNFKITAIISLFMYGWSFLYSWRDAAIQGERLQQENVSYQLKQLKSQLNPHFLFNSLNVLTSLIHEDADQAESFTRKLSQIYRYTLEHNENDLVSLSEELTQMAAYRSLLETRFGEAVRFEVDVEDTAGYVAPLALQLLAENAIKHNISSKKKPLTITIKRNNDHLMITNNKQLKHQATDSTGIGLQNIMERYKLISDQQITVADHNDTFKVIIPIIKQRTR